MRAKDFFCAWAYLSEKEKVSFKKGKTSFRLLQLIFLHANFAVR